MRLAGCVAQGQLPPANSCAFVSRLLHPRHHRHRNRNVDSRPYRKDAIAAMHDSGRWLIASFRGAAEFGLLSGGQASSGKPSVRADLRVHGPEHRPHANRYPPGMKCDAGIRSENAIAPIHAISRRASSSIWRMTPLAVALNVARDRSCHRLSTPEAVNRQHPRRQRGGCEEGKSDEALHSSLRLCSPSLRAPLPR